MIRCDILLIVFSDNLFDAKVKLALLCEQNATDLSDLVSSGRDKNPEEVTFAEEYVLKGLIFRAEVCLCPLLTLFDFV